MWTFHEQVFRSILPLTRTEYNNVSNLFRSLEKVAIPSEGSSTFNRGKGHEKEDKQTGKFIDHVNSGNEFWRLQVGQGSTDEILSPDVFHDAADNSPTTFTTRA